MATCPECLGPLTDGHRCRPRRLARALDRVLTLVAGGLVGVLVASLVNPGASAPPIFAFLIGSLAGLVTREAFRT
jgi:hypothetical protein